MFVFLTQLYLCSLVGFLVFPCRAIHLHCSVTQDYCHCPVQIGPVKLSSNVLDAFHHFRVGMSVIIVQPAAGHNDLGPDCRQKLFRIGGIGTVMPGFE